MARPKRVEASERRQVSASLRSVPYYAYSCDELPGIVGTGRTPTEALANIRAEVRRRFPFAQYDIEETVLP